MFLSLTCEEKFKKSVDHSTSFFSITHTKLLCHTDTAVLQQAQAKTKSGIVYPSIRKFSASRKVSHLNIKSDSRQTQKALLCRHAGFTLRDLCISNVRTPPTSWTETEGVSLMTTLSLLEPTGEQYRREM